jgi:hypothetical protein
MKYILKYIVLVAGLVPLIKKKSAEETNAQLAEQLFLY